LSYLYCKEKEQVMTTLDSIKNRLVDRILAVQDEKFLEAVEKIFVTTQKEEIVKLYSEQNEMLLMSDADIAAGNVVSESELDKLDSQWLY
jgi:nucleoside diphosphate kinase